jgi:hypothetical protein
MLVLQANCVRQLLSHVWCSSRFIIGLVNQSFNIFLESGCTLGCQNGGQCQQTAANTYICVCPPEYTGTQCETSVLGKSFWYKDKQSSLSILVLATHPCVTMAGAICQNGGTCTINPTNLAGYLCNCPAGWNGTNCQIQESMLWLGYK